MKNNKYSERVQVADVVCRRVVSEKEKRKQDNVIAFLFREESPENYGNSIIMTVNNCHGTRVSEFRFVFVLLVLILRVFVLFATEFVFGFFFI